MINDLRISGLASGMDTEGIIQKLMAAERKPLDKQYQSKMYKTWQVDSFREINTKLLDFRSSMEKLRLQSTYNKQTVTSTNSGVVEASTAGTSSLLNYNVTAVSLAQPAQASHIEFTTSVSSATQKLSDAGMAAGTFSITLGTTGYTGATITVDAANTVNDVISNINAKSAETGVKAFFNDGDKKIIFTSIDKGSGKTITISGSPGSTILGIDPTTTHSATNGTALQKASITINGITLQSETNSVVFDGVKFDLKSNMASGTGTVAVAAKTDTESIFNDIKTFVEKYNELIKDLNGKISEKRYRDYQPLLEEQKKDMKDNEIKLWEEKAKSGLLRNDPIVSKFLTSLRTALSSTLEGATDSKFDTLSEIGITTSKNYKENGKLELDETKLKGFIESNLDNVKELFTKSFDTGTISDTTLTSQDKYNKSGLAWRLYDQINGSISELTKQAGAPNSPYDDTKSILAKELDRIDDRIDRFEDRLTQVEDRYWRRFTAMEKAIQQSNMQSGWLMQQFSGGM